MSHVTLKIKISISPLEQTQHLYLRAQGCSYLGPLISTAFDSSSVSRESSGALFPRVCPVLHSELGQLCTVRPPPLPPLQMNQLNPDRHCPQRGGGSALLARGRESIRAASPGPSSMGECCLSAGPGGAARAARGRREAAAELPLPTRGAPTPPGPAWAGLGLPRRRGQPWSDTPGSHPGEARPGREAAGTVRASASSGL